MTIDVSTELWDCETFLAHLHAVGMTRYHHQHPFHAMMNAGLLTPAQIRSWVANRFYYQRNIPCKDAAILANCPIREVRRLWLHRISDHDGTEEGEGGIECWIKLVEATGLTREEVLDERHLLAGVRFAVDGYLHFAHTQPWQIAVASSLTELFAPELMRARLDAFEQHYTWISPDGLDYFRARITQAATDSDQGLALTMRYCTTRQLQEAAVHALTFKCDVLWSMLDAIMIATSDVQNTALQVASHRLTRGI